MKIDKILMNFTVYMNPEVTSIELSYGKDFNLKIMNRYYKQLSSIRWFLKKVLKYELYFSDFYPKETHSISDSEALEHHVHAYLEDLNTLKTKIIDYIGSLKNDLQPIAKNKEEVSGALDF